MQLNNIIAAFALLAPLANALSVPDKSIKPAEEGYAVYFDEGKNFPVPLNGTHSNGTYSNATALDSRALSKRFPWPANTYAWCTNDYFWAEDLYRPNAAWDKFYTACTGRFVNGLYVFKAVNYNVWSNAATYLCDYSTNHQGSNCDKSEWVDAVNWISAACAQGTGGWKQAGYLHVPGWNKRYGFTTAKKERWNIC